MQRRRGSDCLMFVGFLLCLITLTTESATVREGGRRRRRIPSVSPVDIRVGVILDSNSSLGDMALNCTNIALQDFYSTHANYSTKLQLLFRPSGNDVLASALAAWDLIYKENVHAILGPQNSEQARYVVELGYNPDVPVPVIWFSPSGPSLLPPRSRFFINSNSNSNSTRSHCLQFQAIAAIIEAYNWQSVIPIYEEPEFGNDLIPCLTYALQDMDTRVPYIIAISQNSSEDQIKVELNKIKEQRTYVFLAHMTVELWSRLVDYAQNEEMMGKGYAWILTQGLSSMMDPKAKDIIKVKGHINGALGVRPVVVSYIDKLVSLEKKLSKYDKSLSLYGLWAYDTITALAIAVEKASSSFRYRKVTGPKLREEIMDTDFEGLSGNFSLRQGQLEPLEVVVYNVKDQREITIGYWSPERGFHNLSSGDEPAGKFKLLDPTWPGNTKERPPKLKIGVPKTHFTEFVDVSVEGQDISATGFAIDVFSKVLDVLPLNLSYEFVPVKNTNGELTPSSYDDLLCNIANKSLDVIIGDITILVSRTNCVDFTIPYLDSRVSMVVKVRPDSKSGWILFRPFDWLLWLILGGILVAATVAVLILEFKREGEEGSKFQHFFRNPFLIYKSDIDSLRSRTSKSVVIVVMFLLGIAVQVYTANLTSILTEMTTAKPSPWKDVQEIKRNNVSVGYQRDSWVRELLINQIGLKKEQLKPLGSREEYNKALSNEDREKRVDAIFDETPYLMLLLSKCPSCKMTGPIYKTGGFAFAFAKNSTLVSNFSSAILNVTQNVILFRDMKRRISLPITVDKSEYNSHVETRSLTIYDFGVLFIIVLSVLGLFFCFLILKLLLQVPPIARWALWWRSINCLQLTEKLVSFRSVIMGCLQRRSYINN